MHLKPMQVDIRLNKVDFSNTQIMHAMMDKYPYLKIIGSFILSPDALHAHLCAPQFLKTNLDYLHMVKSHMG
jgi:hypothetical protein